MVAEEQKAFISAAKDFFVVAVNKAINKYIDPEKLIKAIAGDFAAASKARAEQE